MTMPSMVAEHDPLEILWVWMSGMRAEIDPELPAWGITLHGFRTIGGRATYLLEVGEQVGKWWRSDLDEGLRSKFLDEIHDAAMSDGDSDYETIEKEGEMRYSVGASSRPVQRDKERKQRLGLDKSDRLKDLGTEVRRLLSQTAGLNAMSEGQYAEFLNRRAELKKQHEKLMEELASIDSDLELVEFACEEADQR